MRRKDREVSDRESIWQILNDCQLIYISVWDGNETYVVPMNFGTVQEQEKWYIYLHSASSGRKIDCFCSFPQVSFSACAHQEIIKSDKACKWTAKYASVMGKGNIHFVDNSQEKISGLNTIMERYGYQGMPVYDEKELGNVTVLRIDIIDVTAKQAH